MQKINSVQFQLLHQSIHLKQRIQVFSLKFLQKVMAFITFFLFMAALISYSDAQQPVSNGDSHGQTKLADLNADVLRQIFDEIHILDILNLIKAYPDDVFFAIANDVFSRRYKEYEVSIDVGKVLNGIDIDDNAKQIKISRKEGAKMLQYFGSAIQNLDIQSISVEMRQCIDKYASESLRKLKLSNCKEDTFIQFTKPFKELKDLILYGHDRIKSGHLQFNQLFPKLQNLTLNFEQTVNLSCIAQAFPSLEKFQFNRMKAHYERIEYQGEEFLEKFFTKNPQIKSIVLDRLAQRTCDAINQYLDNLENLTIAKHLFEIERETIFHNLTNLKHFKVNHIVDELITPGSMSKLTFPQLESLEIGFSPSLTTVWTEFCKNHKNIRYLKIFSFYERNTHMLNQVMNQMPNLEEITLIHDANYFLHSDTIREILQKHQHLGKITFGPMYFNQNVLNQLNEIFGNNWNISSYKVDKYLYHLVFEKKD